MAYHLAQLNIARFSLPKEHPDNSEFIDNLDRVNTIAEAQPGFIWRLIGDGNDALDLQAFDDPQVISNMSLWTGLESLGAFVYRNDEHRKIMRKRKQWFEKIDFHLVLWWVEEGIIPTLQEAIERLEILKKHGASKQAFTFKHAFAAPV